MLKQSLQISREFGDVGVIADDLSRFARAFTVEGSPVGGTRLLARSTALQHDIGVNVRPYVAKRNETTLSILRSRLDEASLAAGWENGQALTVDEAIELALDFEPARSNRIPSRSRPNLKIAVEQEIPG